MDATASSVGRLHMLSGSPVRELLLLELGESACSWAGGEEAVVHLERLLQLEPDNRKAEPVSGWPSHDQQNEKARDLLDKTLALGKTSPIPPPLPPPLLHPPPPPPPLHYTPTHTTETTNYLVNTYAS